MLRLVPTTDVEKDDLPTIESLIERVLDGDPDAWQRFIGRTHPLILRLCRQRTPSNALDSEDIRRDLAQRVLDKLCADDFKRLRHFTDTRASYPNTRFASWLRVVVSNASIDYLRALPEFQRRRTDGTVHLTRLHVEPLAGHEIADDSPGMNTQLEVARIVRCFMNPAFPENQRRALIAWLLGHDADELAEELGLDTRDEARRLLHAARQRLRRAVHGGDPR